MLLTITTTCRPATDLGYLLHKNPARCQEFSLSFGKAHVFYPEAAEDRCTAALLLDVDPVGLIRGRSRNRKGGPLSQYVNDRPFVASSFLSVAISRVFGTALSGRSKERPELAATAIPLAAELTVLPSRGGEEFLRRLFEPLGYEMHLTRQLAELLTHLYVLAPVLDNYKHYYIGDEEREKLLAKGAGWLAGHPERETIARRYLKYQPSLARQALAQLAEEDQPQTLDTPVEAEGDAGEQVLERQISLNEQRLGAVLAAARACGARSVLDLGCGEGNLLRELLRDKRFERIVGVDVSIRSLEIAADRLRLDRLPDRQRRRIELMHGSLMYRDARLAAFERVVLECARPGTIVLTTPNRECNATWENMVIEPATDTTPAVTRLRHRDHRFEWTRAEFHAWADGIAERFGYTVRHLPIGPEDPTLGPPTQMAVFERVEGS